MAPIETYGRKLCSKCNKYTKVYLACFKCDSVYHAKCMLKVSGFQMDQKGYAICCQNITSKDDPAQETVTSQEKLVALEHKWEHSSDEDLENCLSREKDSEQNEFKCDARSLEFTNKEHQENHYKECVDKQEGLTQQLNKNRFSQVNDACIYVNDVRVAGVYAGDKEEKCKLFKCDHCDYEAALQGTLNFHIKVKHSNVEKVHKCSECKYSTHKKWDLVKHMPIHTDEKPFKCDTCNYTAVLKKSLKDHVIAKHSNGEQMYKCHNCKYSTYRKRNLARHMRTHTNERPFKCDHCDYAAIEKLALNLHVLAKHSNAEKEYKCDCCNYSTYIKGNLDKHHMRVHTNEKPFKCDSCAYAAAQKRTLEYHVLARHTSLEKTYKCSDCNYSTYIKSYLLKHARVHKDKQSPI